MNKQQVIDKMDKVVDMYFASKEIDKDSSFRTNLINFTPEIHIFSSIFALSEATGIDVIETLRERSIEYKGVRFFEMRDIAKELEELKKSTQK